MAPYEIAALEARINALDGDTAQRVTHLVFECSASLDLALLAVQEVNRSQEKERQPSTRRRIERVLAYIGAR